jgi:hypothetical protein
MRESTDRSAAAITPRAEKLLDFVDDRADQGSAAASCRGRSLNPSRDERSLDLIQSLRRRGEMVPLTCAGPWIWLFCGRT